ncbi:MAG: hypothetical protein ACRDTG_21575 [Pseudonocardiaceae bacterium]
MAKRRASKEARGLETRRIVYSNRRRPHDKAQELKVDVRRGEVIDDDYAAAMVATRTTLPLADVRIIRITTA